MSKKESTKKQPTREDNRKHLAADIASILNNPETPEVLFLHISDQITNWQNVRDNDEQSGWWTRGAILDCLESYHRAEAKRKGGRS